MLDFDKITLSPAPAPLNPTTGLQIGTVITKLLPYVFAVSGILLLLYFLMGGLQLMLAAGDPKKIQSSWAKITNAAIGFVLIFIAYWLTQLVGNILNIPVIMNIFKF